jgi:Pyrimidine reductase, riboflavin biosynthesis
MTVDGKTTTRNFTPVDFTSREDKLHLFRQRALADAVLIGHTSLKRDNVRLGVPLELQKARRKRGQTPAPIRVIVSDKGKIDNRLENFSVRHFSNRYFFHQANAAEISANPGRKGSAPFKAMENMSILPSCCTPCLIITRFARSRAKAARLCFDHCWSAAWSINLISRSLRPCLGERAHLP